MRYALLICTEDKRQAELSEDEAANQTAAYMAWGEEMGGRGVLRGGERLRPTTTATTASAIHCAAVSRKAASKRQTDCGSGLATGSISEK